MSSSAPIIIIIEMPSALLNEFAASRSVSVSLSQRSRPGRDICISNHCRLCVFGSCELGGSSSLQSKFSLHICEVRESWAFPEMPTTMHIKLQLARRIKSA